MTQSIDTGLFTLRWLQEGDRREFVRMHEVSRQHFGPWMDALAPGETLDDAFGDELTRTRATRADGTGARLVAELPDGSLAGVFALSQVFRRSFQSAYAGWRVSADQVGKGIATLGVKALLDLAFAPEPRGFGLHRVQANIMPSNAASLRVAEKVGFRLEGKAEKYLEIDGVWQDHLMFAKLTDEHPREFLA